MPNEIWSSVVNFSFYTYIYCIHFKFNYIWKHWELSLLHCRSAWYYYSMERKINVEHGLGLYSWYNLWCCLWLPGLWSICQCCLLLHDLTCSVVYFPRFLITCGSCCHGSDFILKLNLSNQILFKSKNVQATHILFYFPTFMFCTSSNCGVVPLMQMRLKMETARRHCDQKDIWRIV